MATTRGLNSLKNAKFYEEKIDSLIAAGNKNALEQRYEIDELKEENKKLKKENRKLKKNSVPSGFEFFNHTDPSLTINDYIEKVIAINAHVVKLREENKRLNGELEACGPDLRQYEELEDLYKNKCEDVGRLNKELTDMEKRHDDYRKRVIDACSLLTSRD
tara:strand:+ start:375 stop:857 length:483 start_codon:yes stop_codon:yes gene_type:complete